MTSPRIAREIFRVRQARRNGLRAWNVNSGVTLGELQPKQLNWYANVWEPKDRPEAKRLKAGWDEDYLVHVLTQ